MWSKVARSAIIVGPSISVLACQQIYDNVKNTSGSSLSENSRKDGYSLQNLTRQGESALAYFLSNSLTLKAVADASSQPVIQHSSVHIQPTAITKWDPNWDSRQPECLVKPEKLAKMTPKERQEALDKLKPKGTRHLIMIRHGQYNMDVDTDAEKTLTSLGREQADFTGKRLNSLGVKFTRLIYSTMVRATETADLITKNLDPNIPKQADPMIEEGAPFPPEPPLGHWRPASKEFLTDGTRIEAAFRKYFHRADPDQDTDTFDVLVCHGNVIRYFVCRALQFPPEGWLRLSLANCSITWLMIRPSGRVVVKSFGDSGHLPPNLVTYS